MLDILAYTGLDLWQASYGVASLLIVLSAYCLGGNKRRGVASILFLLWVINIFYTETSQDFTPVMFFALGDFIIGSFVLLTATSSWQKGVGSWFIAMMTAHIAFWLQEPQTYIVQYNYWMMFTALGWGQLCHVGFWIYKDSRIADFIRLSKTPRLDVDA